MTEPTEKTEPTETTPPAVPAQVPAPRRRRWRRWLWRSFVAVVVLAVVVRVALPFALPRILDAVAAREGIRCSYEDLDLALLLGEVRLTNLTLHARSEDRAAAEPLLARLEYAAVDVDMSALLTGKLRVHRLEVDGLDVELHRGTDGVLQWAKLTKPSTAPAEQPAAPAAKPAPAPGSGPRDPADLSLPLLVDAIRVQHVRVHVIDESTAPRVDTWVEAHVRVTDLGHRERPARVQIHAHGPDLLDGFTIDGTVRQEPEKVEAKFALGLEGLHLPAAACWLRPLGLSPHARSLMAHGKLEARAERATADPSTVDVRLSITGVELTADREPCFGIGSIVAAARGLGGDGVHVPEVAFERLRGQAMRLPNGALRVAGIDLLPLPATAATPTAPATPAPETSSAPLQLRVDAVALRDAALVFHDRGVTPHTTLELRLDELALDNLVSPGVAQPATLRLTAHLPGVLEDLRATARLQLFQATRSVEAELQGNAITLARLQPHLKAAGLAAELRSGALRCSLRASATTDPNGGLQAEAKIANVELRDADQVLLGLPDVAIQDVVVAADGARTRIGAVRLQGGAVPVRRSADGAFHLLGLRTTAASASAAHPPSAPASEPPRPATPPPVAAGDPALARFELGSLQWKGLALSFDDAACTPSTHFATGGFDLELHSLAIGGPRGGDADFASLSLELGLTGLASQLSAVGAITTRPGPLDAAVDLQLRADGLSLMPLAPYLKDAGITPELAKGAARMRIEAKVTAGGTPGSLQARARVSDLELVQEGSESPVQLKEVAIEGVSVADAGIEIAEVRVNGPVLRAARDADGSLHTMGLRIAPPRPAGKTEPAPAGLPTPDGKSTPVPPEKSAGTTRPASGKVEGSRTSGSGEVVQAPGGQAADGTTQPGKVPAPNPPTKPAPAAATATTVAPASTPFSASLRALRVRGVALHFTDRVKSPAVDAAVHIEIDGDGITTRPGAAEQKVALRAKVDGAVEQFELLGSWTLGNQGLDALAKLRGRGIRPGPFAGYLPDNVQATLRDGRLALDLSAQLRRDGTAQSLRCEATDFSFREGDAEPWVAFTGARVVVPKLDPEAKRLEIDEVALRGVRVAAQRDAAGALSLLGLKITPATAETQPKAKAPPSDTAASAPGGKTGSRTPWDVTLRQLEFEIARLRFHEFGAKEPLDVTMRVFNPEPWTVLGKDPESLAPWILKLQAAATPLVESATVVVRAAPWKPDAKLEAEVGVQGIRGGRLAAALPAVAKQLTLDDLKNGSFTAKLETALRLRRRYPTDIDLQRGFGLELHVHEVALKSAPDGEVLLGLAGVDMQAPSIKPGGAVHIASIEVTKPQGRFWKDAEGMHLAGMTLRPAPNPPKNAAPVKPGPVAPAKPANEPTATAQKPGPEMRVDLLSVQGIDVVYQDKTTKPPVTVPLTELDVEARKLTTKALTEQRQIEFSVSMSGGAVALPKRYAASSPLAGALTGMGRLISGKSDKVDVEKRPLLDELAVQGRLELFPQPRGRVRTSIQGLELGGLRGLATQSGVNLADGVFDAGVDLRLQGDKGIATRANFVFGSLDVDEAPGGPISSYLKLPAPLQSVVFALRNDAGEIGIPLSVQVRNGDVSAGQIANAAVSTFAQLVAKALAAAPLRAATSVTGLIGLTGGKKDPIASKAQSIAFTAGCASLPGDADSRFRAILAVLSSDDKVVVELRHEFGLEDLQRAEVLANPTTEQARELCERLRRRRTRLAGEFAETAAAARSYHAVGRTAEATAATATLRRLARERGETESALDAVLDLLRPGAERRADRRTKKMALGIGNARLEEIRRRLMELGGKKLADRIEVRGAKLQRTEGKEPGRVRLLPKLRQDRNT
ncbi:MAG: DUF748 domain-containing protein [Planctomycetes bacterium]|nr:DUF748 domain-containing protein [Planctomycetota bacterium]